MCFNAPVSLTTFLIGIIGSIRLFYLNYKAEAIFYAWVVLMQLIEFFLWRNQPCNKTNLISFGLKSSSSHISFFGTKEYTNPCPPSVKSISKISP